MGRKFVFIQVVTKRISNIHAQNLGCVEGNRWNNPLSKHTKCLTTVQRLNLLFWNKENYSFWLF